MLTRLLQTRGELVLAAAFAVAALGEIWLRRLDHLPALVLLGSLVPLSLAWRVRAPLAVLAVNLAGSVVIELVSERDDYPVALGVVLLVAVYSAGAHTHARRARAATAMLVAGVPVLVAARAEDFDWGDPSTRTNLFVGLVFLTVAFRGAWYAGRWMQRRRARLLASIVEREERARAELQAERARIARELHDVLAHAISVIVLQARGARKSLADHPDDAHDAIDAVERTASLALGEMRRLLTVLRAEDEAATLSPQPSLAQVETLVDEVQAAGLPVDLRIEGVERELPPAVGLCAYRVVQEALTNALKHAGPASARVLVRFGDEALEVEVADTGAGAANGDGIGLGLAGMRERVAVFGGRLESGPRPEGGYVVSARLPL